MNTDCAEAQWSWVTDLRAAAARRVLAAHWAALDAAPSAAQWAARAARLATLGGLADSSAEALEYYIEQIIERMPRPVPQRQTLRLRPQTPHELGNAIFAARDAFDAALSALDAPAALAARMSIAAACAACEAAHAAPSA